MLGINFIKFEPTSYVLQYQRGKLVREGVGLSFFYYSPVTSLVSVPIASSDAPFIFSEVTSDFQEITIQGQVTFRIVDSKKIAGLLNYTLDRSGRAYVSEDPQKPALRVINALKVMLRKELQNLTLRDALRASDTLVKKVTTELKACQEIQAMGLDILGLSILAIKPNPETARALEAEARENILLQADNAIYARRNSAVDQERAIKENELNTEIAVEHKKRQIRETQMEAEKSVREKQHELDKAEMTSKISLEAQNRDLIKIAIDNEKAQADTRAYGISTMMNAVKSVDPAILQALASVGMRPEQMMAVAFQGLAAKAEKIGQLNISPELLRELMQHQEFTHKQ